MLTQRLRAALAELAAALAEEDAPQTPRRLMSEDQRNVLSARARENWARGVYANRKPRTKAPADFGEQMLSEGNIPGDLQAAIDANRKITA